MNIADKILDLSLRKLIRRTRALWGKGDPWSRPSSDITDLLTAEQAARIASMPRFTPGELKFDGLDIVFNDNNALLGMLDEIFIRKNYSFTTSNSRPLIIDCGANIGLSVIYFKQRYPDAEVHAFEPDVSAFECLAENVRRNGLQDVHIYQNAVWVENKTLEFYSDGSWGGGIHPKSGARKTVVQAIDIANLLDRPVDFLKMDIEGAETEVINHNISKIKSNVERFFFEWHSIKGRPQELGNILGQFEEAGFRYHIKEASHRPAPFEYTPPGSMDSQLDVFLNRGGVAIKLMMTEKDKPVLSICIPTYNGHAHVTTLIEELLSSSRTDFEIVVCDDCSTDNTWEYIEQKSYEDQRVNCFRNTHNVGMDANFANTVSLAKGEYVWLCGQDDKIFHDGIDAVVALLRERPNLDFVCMNHVKVDEVDDTASSLAELKPVSGKHHVYGHGLISYLKHHNYELPTFLPKYIIRKGLWDSVDIAEYYGTFYCQVGAFLEVSRNLNWCHMDGNYVVGLTPENGWQSDSEQFTKISLGMYSMLFRASQKAIWMNVNVLASLVNKNYKRLILSCLIIKSYHIPVNNRTISETLEVIKHSLPLHFLIMVILKMPSWFSLSLLGLVKGRRRIRSRIMGVAPQGPKID